LVVELGRVGIIELQVALFPSDGALKSSDYKGQEHDKTSVERWSQSA